MEFYTPHYSFLLNSKAFLTFSLNGKINIDKKIYEGILFYILKFFVLSFLELL